MQNVHSLGRTEKERFTQSPPNRELDKKGRTRVRVEDFPRPCFAGASASLKHDGARQHSARKFQGSIIFMSMFNDIDWNRKGNEKSCIRNSSSVAKDARKFHKRHWSFLGLESKEKRRYSWISVAEHMMMTFVDSGYLLLRRALKIKGCGRTSTHYNADQRR